MAHYELTKEQAWEISEKLQERDDTSNVRPIVSMGWAVRFDIHWEGYTIEAEIHEPQEPEGPFLGK